MKDGGPAFPHVAEFIDRVGTTITSRQITEGGMSLRDYFAGQALSAMPIQICVETPAATYMAVSAYLIADAMLKAREE
jgi:hypothetical protein